MSVDGATAEEVHLRVNAPSHNPDHNLFQKWNDLFVALARAYALEIYKNQTINCS